MAEVNLADRFTLCLSPCTDASFRFASLNLCLALVCASKASSMYVFACMACLSARLATPVVRLNLDCARVSFVLSDR